MAGPIRFARQHRLLGKWVIMQGWDDADEPGSNGGIRLRVPRRCESSIVKVIG
jgi:hypothetical protein